MIALFTDFGLEGPYVGQVKAVLLGLAPGVPVVDLMADAPACDPRRAAYLLAALAPEMPAAAVLLCVVDPGVGTDRTPMVAEMDGRLLVGPDNGLFEPLSRRAAVARFWEITWRPQRLSASFHGRDLFAPVAARLALGEPPPGTPIALDALIRPDWPDDLPHVVYVDAYGNALTGLRAAVLPATARLRVNGHTIARGRTFADAPAGAALWYENANGLAEIAVNGGRADTGLCVGVGTAVAIV